jgi:acyl-[acyl carrier protein]--UDP-N-acetylglucosamine O-acyltransferase
MVTASDAWAAGSTNSTVAVVGLSGSVLISSHSSHDCVVENTIIRNNIESIFFIF